MIKVIKLTCNLISEHLFFALAFLFATFYLSSRRPFCHFACFDKFDLQSVVFSGWIFHTRLQPRFSSTNGMKLPVVTLKSVVILGFCCFICATCCRPNERGKCKMFSKSVTRPTHILRYTVSWCRRISRDLTRVYREISSKMAWTALSQKVFEISTECNPDHCVQLLRVVRYSLRQQRVSITA